MAEILLQLIDSLSHYLQGFIHPRWCKISAINNITKDIYFFFLSRDFWSSKIGEYDSQSLTSSGKTCNFGML